MHAIDPGRCPSSNHCNSCVTILAPCTQSTPKSFYQIPDYRRLDTELNVAMLSAISSSKQNRIQGMTEPWSRHFGNKRKPVLSVQDRPKLELESRMWAASLLAETQTRTRQALLLFSILTLQPHG